jgi:hypothetical protein
MLSPVQKNILKIVLLVAVLVIIYFSYKMFTKSSFGFGAVNYSDPGPNGLEIVPYTPGSFTCYNAIPKTGWVGGSDTVPLTNPGVTGGSATSELEMFQQFMSTQPNIVSFMGNDTMVTPVLVLSTGALDTVNTSLKLFESLVTSNSGKAIVIKDGTISGASISNVYTVVTSNPDNTTISLNQAVSIPKTITNIDPAVVSAYESTRANIIIGVLNSLHFIYYPGDTLKTTPKYTSISKSIGSTAKTEGVATLNGGDTTKDKYVGIIQELYNNYPIDQPSTSDLSIGVYEKYGNIQLALTPNAKHAVWIYLYARDAWIQEQINGFIGNSTSNPVVKPNYKQL